MCQGDRIIVDVINLLHSESTAMHWHGQHHVKTPYMDGVPYVSQCPILPGSTFRYDYIATEAGTHFWHSHLGARALSIKRLISRLFVKSVNRF